MADHLDVAALLFNRGAVQVSEGGFRLKKHEKDPYAPLSPVFLNIRSERHPTKPGPLSDEDITLIARQLYHLAISEDISFDGVAGVPEAGNPIAEAFWNIADPYQRRKPVTLRKERSEDGTTRITGILDTGGCEPGDIILLLDDLVSEADSKLEVITVLRENGFLVQDALVVVDREQGGDEELWRVGCTLHTLFTLTHLLCFGVQTGEVSDHLFRRVQIYLQEEQERREGGSS